MFYGQVSHALVHRRCAGFLFCLLYGPVFLPHFSKVDTAHEQVLTIMTFKILGFRDSEDTANAILQNGVLPDIVALQEVTPQFIPKILKHTQFLCQF